MAATRPVALAQAGLAGVEPLLALVEALAPFIQEPTLHLITLLDARLTIVEREKGLNTRETGLSEREDALRPLQEEAQATKDKYVGLLAEHRDFVARVGGD